MPTITISTALNQIGFRTGLQDMKAEATRFKQSFGKTLSNGGGLLGALDSGAGALASGRFAAPIAAIGAALVVARAGVRGYLNEWENVEAQMKRAHDEAEAIKEINLQAQRQQYQGTAGSKENALEVKLAKGAAQSDTDRANSLIDPSTRAFAAGAQQADAQHWWSKAYFGSVAWLGSMGVPFASSTYEGINKNYNDSQDAASSSREKSQQLSQNQKFVDFSNEMDQRHSENAEVNAYNAALSAAGKIKGIDATAMKVSQAMTIYNRTKDMYGADDPRTLDARAVAFSATSDFNQQFISAQRYRNDPEIKADSLARLGGGGGVNVFGDGKGEYLFTARAQLTYLQKIAETLGTMSGALVKGGQIE